MDASTAVQLINNFVYPPRMSVRAEKSWLWNNVVEVTTTMETFDSGSPMRPTEWKKGYPTPLDSRALFAIDARKYGTATDLLHKIIKILVMVQEHEIREFTRRSDGIAPFHPHTSSGQLAWGTPGTDVNYGLEPGIKV